MKALTVRQPWAWALLHAGKDIENRSWTTKHRGHLGLHTSAYYTKAEVDAAVTGPYWGSALVPNDDDLVAGAILGVLDLDGIHHANDCTNPTTGQLCSPWAQPGLYHWQVSPTVVCDPYPTKGSLQLWNAPNLADLPGVTNLTYRPNHTQDRNTR